MKKFYFLVFFIPFLFHPQLHAQGRFEVFGLEAWSAPKTNYNFSYYGFGMMRLCDTTTFHRIKSLDPTWFQFGGGFTFGQFGSKNLIGIPLPNLQSDSASISIVNRSATFFGTARCILPMENNGKALFPYFDFFTGYRLLRSRMVTDAIGIDGFENRNVTFPGKASGFLLGAGVGVNFQIHCSKTLILFDSELVWNYSPECHETLANTSTLQRSISGIDLDVQKAAHNMVMLKIGFSFGKLRESYNNMVGYMNAYTPPPSNGKGGAHGGGGHGGHSGGGHVGHGK